MTDNLSITTDADTNDIGTALNPAFCTIEDWRPCLPDEVATRPDAAWMQASREGRAPSFMRVCGKASPAVYAKKEISDWFFTLWSRTHPGALKKLVMSGFPEPSQFAPFRTKLENQKKNVTFDDVMKAIKDMRAKDEAIARAEKALQEAQKKKRKKAAMAAHSVRDQYKARQKAKP